MKRFLAAIIIFLLSVICSGCMSGLLNKIPEQEFKKFTYARTGNITSAHVDATDCRLTDKKLKCAHVRIEGSYPVVNIQIEIENYSRDIEK